MYQGAWNSPALTLRYEEVLWPPLEIRFAIQAAQTCRPSVHDVLHTVLGGEGAWNSPPVRCEEVPRPPLEIRNSDPSCPDLHDSTVEVSARAGLGRVELPQCFTVKRVPRPPLEIRFFAIHAARALWDEYACIGFR